MPQMNQVFQKVGFSNKARKALRTYPEGSLLEQVPTQPGCLEEGFPDMDPEQRRLLLDLLRGMLNPCSARRISPDDALLHGYFKPIHRGTNFHHKHINRDHQRPPPTEWLRQVAQTAAGGKKVVEVDIASSVVVPKVSLAEFPAALPVVMPADPLGACTFQMASIRFKLPPNCKPSTAGLMGALVTRPVSILYQYPP